jgi:hypothetical protein
MDRLFDDFTGDFWRRSLFNLAPFRRAEAAFRAMAVDVTETDKAQKKCREVAG